MAYHSRRGVVEKHDEHDLPPLSISTLRRLEARGVFKSKRFSPGGPAYLSDGDIDAIRDHFCAGGGEANVG